MFGKLPSNIRCHVKTGGLDSNSEEDVEVACLELSTGIIRLESHKKVFIDSTGNSFVDIRNGQGWRRVKMGESANGIFILDADSLRWLAFSARRLDGLTGYRYKEQPASVSLRPFGGEWWAGILVNGDIVADKCAKKSKTLVRWLSKTLDGQPESFGHAIDLKKMDAEAAADASVKGDGAEFYVMGYLMMAFGIVATQANRNMPGYDVLAYHPASKKSCRIQVKYRNSSSGFVVTNFDFDFLIYVCAPDLKTEKCATLDGGDRESRTVHQWPVYIVPVEVVIADTEFKKSNYVTVRYSNYFQNWRLILDFLL